MSSPSTNMMSSMNEGIDAAGASAAATGYHPSAFTQPATAGNTSQMSTDYPDHRYVPGKKWARSFTWKRFGYGRVGPRSQPYACPEPINTVRHIKMRPLLDFIFQTLWLLAIGRRRFETIGWKSDVSPAMTSKRIFHLGHLLIHAGFMMKKLPKASVWKTKRYI